MILAANRCRDRSPNIYVADSLSEIEGILNPRLGDVAMIATSGSFAVYRLFELDDHIVDDLNVLGSNSCEHVWISSGVGSGELDVALFGAVGDDLSDDTEPINKAIHSAPNGSEIIFPPGTYRVTNILLEDKSKVTLRGIGGATIRIIGTEPDDPPQIRYSGLRLGGTLVDCAIKDLGFIGDGTSASNQAAIWTLTGSGFALTNLVIENCRIDDCTAGIILSGTTGDSFNASIVANRITNIVGTGSGQGYGIATSLGGSQQVNTVINRNIIRRCQRHSIYWSVGSGGIISDNTVIEHRFGQTSPGFYLSAINIARSGGVTIIGNRVHKANDAGMSISSDVGFENNSVSVIGNHFYMPTINYADIAVGQSTPATTGSPTNVTIIGNVHERDGLTASPLRILCGKRINVVNNEYRILAAGGNASPFDLSFQDETAGTANHASRVAFTGNFGLVQCASGTPYGAIFTTVSSESAVDVSFTGNRFEGVSQFCRFLSTQTNPNILFHDNDTSGWDASISNPSEFGQATFTGYVEALSAFRTSIGTGPSGVAHYRLRLSDGTNRWLIGLIESESGANSGSNFLLSAFNDAGVFLGNALTLERDTFRAIFGGNIEATNRLETDTSSTSGHTRLFIYDANSTSLQRVKVGANGTGPGGVGRALYFDNA